MCIRSAFVTDIVAAFAAIDTEYYGDDFARDATTALLALPSKAIGHPFSVAGALIKADFFTKDDFGHVVKTVGRACRGYARFLQRQGDLFNGMPAAPAKAARKPRPAAIAKPKEKAKRNAYKAPRGLRLARKHRKAAELRATALAEYAAAIAAAPPAEPDRSLVQKFDKRVAAALAADRAAALTPRPFAAVNVVDFCAIRAARLQA